MIPRQDISRSPTRPFSSSSSSSIRPFFLFPTVKIITGQSSKIMEIFRGGGSVAENADKETRRRLLHDPSRGWRKDSPQIFAFEEESELPRRTRSSHNLQRGRTGRNVIARFWSPTSTPRYKKPFRDLVEPSNEGLSKANGAKTRDSLRVFSDHFS